MESMVREQEKQDFYPRPPRGGRPNSPPEEILCKVISIHALREEGDFQNGGIGGFNVLFLSTPSARRATSSYTLYLVSLVDFYPRPPRGGRRSSSKGNGKACKFLSTPSARRATPAPPGQSRPSAISIHALREEGDHRRMAATFSPQIFLSTPSARRATSYESTPIR